jgi:hypothetical protein
LVTCWNNYRYALITNSLKEQRYPVGEIAQVGAVIAVLPDKTVQNLLRRTTPAETLQCEAKLLSAAGDRTSYRERKLRRCKPAT